MKATGKDSVWKCLILPSELDFNIMNNEINNANKKLQFKNKVNSPHPSPILIKVNQNL